MREEYKKITKLEIANSKLNKLVLKLEIQNAELKDELNRLGYVHTFGVPTDALEVGNPEDFGEEPWIYESPDNGKTVFRRKANNYDSNHKEEIVDGKPTGRVFSQYNTDKWDNLNQLNMFDE